VFVGLDSAVGVRAGFVGELLLMMRNRSPAKAQAAMNGGKRQDPYPGGNLVPPQRARSPSKHRSPSPNGAGHLPNMAVVAPSPFVAAAITPRGKPANGAAKRERTPPAILGRRVLPNMPLGEVAQAMKQRNVDRFTPSGEVSYIRGDLVEYHSGSYKCWVPTHVEQVDLETGAVTVAVRPREPIRKEDLKTLIRRRRKPSFEQLEWVRRLLSTGRIESEAETIFALHASRLGGGEWGLVPGSFLIVASDIDEKTGVSGFLRGLYSEYQRYSVEYLSLEQFQSLFWDHLQFAKECTRIIPQGNDRYRYSADPKQAYNFKDWKVLGEGTFGKVVLAYTHGTNDRRAVKLVNKGGLNQNFDFLAREIDNLCNLDHPHIARLYEYMEDAKTLYLVMDFCSGGDLHQKIRAAEKSRQPLRESYIAEAMRQVLFAIGYVHARGICHLDLKPANIMLMPSKAVNPPVKDAVQTVPKDFEKPHVCVIDFGVAQFFSAGSFRNGRPAGTPYTMAPEVWKGEITPKADIWSVGVTMFEMCCARFPVSMRIVFDFVPSSLPVRRSGRRELGLELLASRAAGCLVSNEESIRGRPACNGRDDACRSTSAPWLFTLALLACLQELEHLQERGSYAQGNQRGSEGSRRLAQQESPLHEHLLGSGSAVACQSQSECEGSLHRVEHGWPWTS